MKQNRNKERIMFIDDKTNIVDEVSQINGTLRQISEIDRRLRVENKNYIGQINELNNKNQKVTEELIHAVNMEKKARYLRFRDVGITLGFLVMFAMYVTYLSF